MSEQEPGWEDDDPWTEADERRYQSRRARDRARRRRARRRAAIFALIVLLVMGTGVYAAGLFQGAWSWPPFGGGTASSPSGTPCPSLTRTAAPPRDVRVRVYNATDRSGLAARVASQLQSRGFAVPEIDNDPAGGTVTEPAQVRYGPQGLAAARAVAAQVPGAVLVDDGREGSDVDLALGAGYGDRLASSDTVATLTTPVPVTGTPDGCVPAGSTDAPTGTPAPTSTA